MALSTGASLRPAPVAASEDSPVRYIDEVVTEVAVTSAIAYGDDLDDPGEVLLLDLFEPAGDTEGARPVIIWAHGGGFTSGSRTSTNIRQLAEGFARRGYVTASIDYRLSDTEGVAAIERAVVDLRQAVRWFRANAEDLGIDPARISAGGYSAGAVMALTAALDGGATPGAHQGWSSDVASALSFSGAGLSDGTAGDPPILLFHGVDDTRVAYGGSLFSGVRTCEVARFFGTDCVFWSFPGVGHGIFDDGSRDALMLAETARFLSCRVGAGGVFTDLPPWVEQAAGWAARSGVVAGYPAGTFRADQPVARGQLVAMLWRLVGRPSGAPPSGLGDVPAWLAPAMDWAVAEGVVTGYPDRTSRPGQAVTRAQAARMLYRTAGAVAVDDLPATGLAGVPAWAADAVRWLVAPRAVQLLGGEGIATGYPDESFRANRVVTRGQIVDWLHGLALTGAAWDLDRQAEPEDTACYREGDP